MAISTREYAGLVDLEAIQGLTSVLAGRPAPAGPLWHPGNAAWNLYTGMRGLDPREASERIRLWRDGARLLGFAAAFGDGEAHVDVLPGHAAERAVWDEAWGWAEQFAAREDSEACSLFALTSDGERRARLEAAGYLLSERPGQPRMRIDLDAPVAAPELPEGMRFRDCVDVDLEERAAAHRDAWEHLEHIGIDGARSAFSRERYELLRAAPGYDASLDFAIEDADGTIAACCITWADPASGLALFEPVGTREAYRRRGLARALVLGALGRLRRRGLRRALISTAHFNAPAIRTYESCGFEIVDRELTYTKRLGGSAAD